MLTIKDGFIQDEKGVPVLPVAILLDKQDGSSLVTATNADDGSGYFNVGEQVAKDFTVTIYDPTLKHQGASFHLSKPPANITFDAVAGRLVVKLPFA